MTIPRPFGVHYNPYTQAIEVIDGREQIVNMVRTLRSEIKILFIELFIYLFISSDDMDVVLDALRKTELTQTK